jgi:hypothetical protein
MKKKIDGISVAKNIVDWLNAYSKNSGLETL